MDADAHAMDGDGDIDLVLAIEFGANILLINDGNGVFTRSGGLPDSAHDSEDIAVADFNNDGLLDIFFVSEDDQVNELFLNQGDGTYVDASTRINFGGISNAVVAFDLNNDGAMDLIIGNVGQLAVLINDGSGFFSNETQTRFSLDSYRIQGLTLADVDNDGDLDLLTADERRNRIFINDGDGFFTDETSGRVPNVEDETREVITADIDNDGDLDIYYANVTFLTNYAANNRLLLNNGAGVFEEVTSQLSTNPGENNFSATFVELTGDDTPDLIVPSSNVFGNEAGSYAIYANDSTGRFIKANLATALPEGNGFDIATADFNNDGKMDMYLCNRSTGNPGTSSSVGGTDALIFGD
ncbi:MAG: VCBS repeat-containing protein, partial [Algicola sp.]|nr:VCBS repeat-containing protein [Algicola sp.]